MALSDRTAESYARRVPLGTVRRCRAVAEATEVPPALLLTLLLQECQFYHYRLGARVITEALLLLRHLPLRRLRDKSLGVVSLKPQTARRLLLSALDRRVSEDVAARLVARHETLSLLLAAGELKSFLDCGATPEVAFLAFAARDRTADQLLLRPDSILAEVPAFRSRLTAYRQYAPRAVGLLSRQGPQHVTPERRRGGWTPGTRP